MVVWIGLTLAFVSAITVNWAYSREHDAANALPPVSARRPLASARTLVASREWLLGFGGETTGWLIYVAALRLAPLALVQAVSASGIAALALIQSRGHPTRLARRERYATRLALLGLVLLGISLVGSHPSDHAPRALAAVVWLGGCFGAAALIGTAMSMRLEHAAALGLAAGTLFAAGDMSAKLVVLGGWWFLGAVPLVAAYAAGSIELQAAFQHGDALTAAGIATLATNAIPIAAGVVLFDQTLPSGWQRVLQLVAFGAIVASGTLLNDPRATQASRGRALAEARQHP